MPRPGSAVMLTIGDSPFMLVGRDDWAWSRGPRQESAIISAMRGGVRMKIEARDRFGRRFIDYYLLAGAPTAIDAAAPDLKNAPPKLKVSAIDDGHPPPPPPPNGGKADDRLQKWRDNLARDPFVDECVEILSDIK